ncbi:MAG: NAD(P)H-dependent oxidoreductase [Terracidiphilus sp.]|nr:NAD(P)H-dependent oxidoreductase [Terracidiphilus sp.]
MSTILQIDSSPRTESVSSAFAARYVAGLKQKDPAATVYHHNTGYEKLPYVDEAALGVLYGSPENPTEEQKKILALSDQLIDELLAADTIVFGVPMWNFGIPASLKAWVDLISRPGRTFQYVAGGGVAPLVPADKKAVVFASHGGSYTEGSPWAAFNQADPYIRTIFGFFGITDVTFVPIDNQNRSGSAPAEGLAAAEQQLAALLA